MLVESRLQFYIREFVFQHPEICVSVIVFVSPSYYLCLAIICLAFELLFSFGNMFCVGIIIFVG